MRAVSRQLDLGHVTISRTNEGDGRLGFRGSG
jgi:hypothetical protein